MEWSACKWSSVHTGFSLPQASWLELEAQSAVAKRQHRFELSPLLPLQLQSTAWPYWAHLDACGDALPSSDLTFYWVSKASARSLLLVDSKLPSLALCTSCEFKLSTYPSSFWAALETSSRWPYDWCYKPSSVLMASRLCLTSYLSFLSLQPPYAVSFCHNEHTLSLRTQAEHSCHSRYWVYRNLIPLIQSYNWSV